MYSVNQQMGSVSGLVNPIFKWMAGGWTQFWKKEANIQDHLHISPWFVREKAKWHLANAKLSVWDG